MCVGVTVLGLFEETRRVDAAVASVCAVLGLGGEATLFGPGESGS